MTMPSGHLHTLKAKWLRNGFERGMAAEEPGADEYAVEGLNPCSAIQVWPCRSDVKWEGPPVVLTCLPIAWPPEPDF